MVDNEAPAKTDMKALTQDEFVLIGENKKIAAMLSYIKRTGANEASAYAFIHDEVDRIARA